MFTSSVEATHRLYLLLAALTCLPGRVVEYSSLVPPGERGARLEAFRSGAAQVLVCSDAMTRGMDVAGVAAVVNYDAPVYVKTYVHRAGRTARAGECSGARRAAWRWRWGAAAGGRALPCPVPCSLPLPTHSSRLPCILPSPLPSPRQPRPRGPRVHAAAARGRAPLQGYAPQGAPLAASCCLLHLAASPCCRAPALRAALRRPKHAL